MTISTAGLRWSITITWGAVARAAQYLVQRSTNNQASWVTIATLPTGTVSYLDVNVPHGALWYRIIAQNSVGSTSGNNPLFWFAPGTAGAPTFQNTDVPSGGHDVSTTVTWKPTLSDPSVQIIERSEDGIDWVTVGGSLGPAVASFLDLGSGVFGYVNIDFPPIHWAVAYRVERSIDYVTWVSLGTNSFNGLHDTDPPLDQWVHYRVVAINSVGETVGVSAGIWVSSMEPLRPCVTYLYRCDSINSAGLTLGDQGANTTNPPVLQMSVATSEVPLQITLNWRPNPFFRGEGDLYGLFRSTVAPGANQVTLALSLQDPTYTDAAIQPGTLYFYRTIIGLDFGPWVGVYSPGPVAPAAPTVIRDPLLPWVDVMWLPSLGADTYGVERSIDSGASWQLQATGLYGQFWVDTNMPDGPATLEYRIIASDPIYSATGPATPITRLFATPPTPTLTNDAAGVIVTFSAHEGAGFLYNVERSPDNLTWTQLVQLGPNGGSGFHSYTYTDTTAVAYHRYYYRIVAATFSAGTQIGFSTSIVFKVPGSPAGYRIVVNGDDVSAIVKRGTDLTVDDAISQKGAVAAFTLEYEGANSPPVILTR